MRRMFCFVALLMAVVASGCITPVAFPPKGVPPAPDTPEGEPRIALSGNEEEFRAEVARLFPVGISVYEAQELMERSGFECLVYEDEGIPVLLGKRSQAVTFGVSWEWKIWCCYSESRVFDTVASSGDVAF